MSICVHLRLINLFFTSCPSWLDISVLSVAIGRNCISSIPALIRISSMTTCRLSRVTKRVTTGAPDSALKTARMIYSLLAATFASQKWRRGRDLQGGALGDKPTYCCFAAGGFSSRQETERAGFEPAVQFINRTTV